jgi:hypothetical protein
MIAPLSDMKSMVFSHRILEFRERKSHLHPSTLPFLRKAVVNRREVPMHSPKPPELK